MAEKEGLTAKFKLNLDLLKNGLAMRFICVNLCYQKNLKFITPYDNRLYNIFSTEFITSSVVYCSIKTNKPSEEVKLI